MIDVDRILDWFYNLDAERQNDLWIESSAVDEQQLAMYIEEHYGYSRKQIHNWNTSER